MVLGHTCGRVAKYEQKQIGGGRNRLGREHQVEVVPGAVHHLPLFAPPDDDLLLVTLEQLCRHSLLK